MKNQMSKYDSGREDKKTLETMANNFDQWYDGDPTTEQQEEFEKNRKKKIRATYDGLKKNLELEEKSFEMVSDDADVQNTISDITQFHKNQYRKIWRVPYVQYPLAVAKIISRITTDKNLIIAWLLHDVKEDVENGEELLKEKYPSEIVTLVNDVSEQDKSLPRKERKIAYIQHLDEVSSKAIILSLSDRIHNLREMISSFEQLWYKMFENFNAWFNEQKRFILSYSLQIKKIIDKIQDMKMKGQCLDLYKELSWLIWYFLELGDKMK